MILLVDIGNSRIKWGLREGPEWRMRGVATHKDVVFEALLEDVWGALETPARILVANVAGKNIAAALRAWVRRVWTLEVELLVPRRKACGVVNAYVEAQRLGADRWAALIGAHALVAGNVCVIDCGSALTFDALDADGRHLGGLIVPGLAMMRDALIRDTSGIRDQALTTGDDKVSVLARDTQGGVSGGALYAMIAVIDRVTADLAADLQASSPLTLVISGGDAERLLPLLAGQYRHEPDLVLHGLSIIAESGE